MGSKFLKKHQLTFDDEFNLMSGLPHHIFEVTLIDSPIRSLQVADREVVATNGDAVCLL